MKGLFRRIVAVTAVFALIFCAMAISPSAASADISIRIDATSYSQDDQITAEVYFQRAYKKISSLAMSLLYDSQKLEFVSMKQGKDLRRARDKQTTMSSQEFSLQLFSRSKAMQITEVAS